MDLEDVLLGLLLAKARPFHGPARNLGDRRRGRKLVLEGFRLVVDRDVDLAAAVGMEYRVIMAMERVVVLQGLVVVLLENQELGDIDTALLHQGKEITDDGSSFQFEAIERLGSGREKDYSLHLSVSSVPARQLAALEHWIG
ncbi:hypothetical protein [Terribium terrae]|uniref:hypothetical protein n=1 Tax=Mesorhizobium sp. TaxID=1871066 RepID=UPI001ACC35DF|nr:hypothetical protein [Mesorhizobium sp.]MBN9235856.1 hypothetical protein [Mesorhizobium sp.]